MASLPTAVRVAALTLVATGLLYPLAVTGLAQLFFPASAGGSLVRDGTGQVVGSGLLAQRFDAAGYFHPRPSAAGGGGWDAAASAGSSLGPSSRRLRELASSRLERLLRENPEAPRTVPAELVAASGSGLDPHLSPAGADWQVPRVARARGLDPARVRALVQDLRQRRDLGVLGEPRVEVLALNLALDRQFGVPSGQLRAPR